MHKIILPTVDFQYCKFYENFASTNADNETVCTVLLTSQVVLVQVYNQKVLGSSQPKYFFFFLVFLPLYLILLTSLL